MNSDANKSNQEIIEFTEKTRKEVKIWDWLGRVIPLTVLTILTVLHFAEFHTLRDTILNISFIVFLTACFVWWFWALRKIVSSVNYIQQAHIKFLDITKELRKMRRDIDKNDSIR